MRFIYVSSVWRILTFKGKRNNSKDVSALHIVVFILQRRIPEQEDKRLRYQTGETDGPLLDIGIDI